MIDRFIREQYDKIIINNSSELFLDELKELSPRAYDIVLKSMHEVFQEGKVFAVKMMQAKGLKVPKIK